MWSIVADHRLPQWHRAGTTVAVTNQPLRVGIAGARGLSTINGLRSVEGVEVTALCDLHAGVLAERSAALGIEQTFRVYEDLLDSDIDAVVIATPMQFHVQQTIQALEAGKHVLCEVTAGVTMDELWWLTEAVAKSDRTYMMAENYCYIPEVQLVTELAAQGRFGELYLGEGEYLHSIRHLAHGYNRRATDETAIDEQAMATTSWRAYWQLGKRGNFYPTHSLGPVMQWLRAGRMAQYGADAPPDPIVSVSSFGTGWHTAPELRQEDSSETIVKLASGAMIRLRTDCLSHRPHTVYYALQGTGGAFEAPRGLGDTHKVYFHSPGDDVEQAEWRPLLDFADQASPELREILAGGAADEHWGSDTLIAQDFVRAIRTGQSPAIDVHDACEWTAVGLLSELSIMNDGRPITMPDFRSAGLQTPESRRAQELRLL